MMQKPFELPDEIIIDPQTGYAVNVALSYQGEPFWWEVQPDVVERIKAARAKLGITVEDFPDGVPVRIAEQTVSMDEIIEHFAKEQQEGDGS